MKRALQLFTLLWLPILVCSATVAQTRIITGSVSDSKGQPIIGASIVVKGTTTGTYSDADGKFTLAVPQSATTLVVKFIGMKTQEVALGTSNEIPVTLNEDVLGLDEVVVTANAISREKRSLGYATTQVSTSELNAGDNTNMLSALEGKVTGVDVINMTGAPGSSQSIVIRGGSSILGNNQALIVVDGVPIDNGNFRDGDDLNAQIDYGNRGNDIDPDDIESISVLKGPAAAALYGSRASNGALIITTKKGKHTGANSKIDVTVHSGVTFSSVLKLPTYQNTYGEGNVEAIEDDRRENFSWGLPFNGEERPWGQQVMINGVLEQQIKPYSAIPDNVLDFFNTGVAYKNDVSFSGGSEKSTYYLSVGTLNSTGIVPTEAYNKYNILFNGSTELANHFTTSINLCYANISATDPDAGQGNQSFYQQLLLTPRDIPIVDGKNLNSPFNQYNNATGIYTYYAAYSIDPYFSLDNYQNTNNVDRLFGNITTTYNPIKGLYIMDRFSGDIYSDRRYESWAEYDYVAADQPFYASDPQEYQGKYSQNIFNQTNIENDLRVTYQHDLSKDFTGTILVGQDARQFILTELDAQTNPQGGLSVPGYFNLSNSNGPALITNQLFETRNVGYYGDLTLGFRNMLTLDLTGRNDYSSTLVAGNNSYFYPSASLAWVFTDLMHGKFKSNILSYGKLRASYASVGNDAPAYVTSNTFGVANIPGSFGSTQFPLGTVPGYSQSSLLANPDLKPEFTTSEEVGAELEFLNGRIGGDVTFYEKTSTNQIISLPLPASTGFLSEEANTGEVQNKGVEVSAHFTPIQTKSGFKWDVYGTYTKNENEVVSLANGVQQVDIGGFSGLDIVAQVGKPYGSFYGIDLLKDPQGNVVVGANGLPQTTPNLVYLGNFQPNYIASWGTSFSYKGFTLSALFDTKQGGVFYSQTKSDMDFGGYATETLNRTPHVWPGSVVQNADGSYSPNTTPYDPEVFFTTIAPAETGTQMVDASYIKLREVRLGYKLPDKWMKKTPFGTLTVSVFGNNLVLWTPKSNQYVDPELNSSGAGNAQGFEFLAIPSQRNYGIDLKFTF